MATEGRKRIRRDPETARRLILEEAGRLMVEEGYAAVTTRRIAQELGINAATVHYYYPATDDLFVALHARMTERQLVELEAALRSPDPLRAFWYFQSGWAQSALGVEFLALSNHRKALRERLADVTTEAREAQAGAISQALGQLSPDPERVPPMALATILVAIARLLANEERVGITSGHAEVRSVVERALAELGPRG